MNLNGPALSFGAAAAGLSLPLAPQRGGAVGRPLSTPEQRGSGAEGRHGQGSATHMWGERKVWLTQVCVGPL